MKKPLQPFSPSLWIATFSFLVGASIAFHVTSPDDRGIKSFIANVFYTCNGYFGGDSHDCGRTIGSRLTHLGFNAFVLVCSLLS